MFLTPPSWPNCISVQDGKGFWAHEQRHDRQPEKAWLLDFKTGKVLNTVVTNSANTSGMTYGDGCVWSGANGASVHNHPEPPVNGVFQTDTKGKQISHRQIPFGPADNGGPCHGLAWENGKLWISSNRLESLVRLDPKTWQVDWMFPHTTRPELKDRMLFITGDTVNENTMKALQSTGVPYIEKPFRVQELINIVETIFGKAE